MMAQRTLRFGSMTISFISTWPAVMISTPSNTSHSSIKEQPGIWLNSLPAESIGSWEDLEAAFLDNFQGTYVRPPDADDLSHIIQQPDESARQFWTRFLTKKNQIVDCPDAEALAAFKHNIRDEWLARHLGQEKPKSMAGLTSLMTPFCAGEDSGLASCPLPRRGGS